MRTVSNTSPISNLAIIGQLHLLQQQFEQVFVPQAVVSECERIAHEPSRRVIFQAIESAWLVITPVMDGRMVDSLLASLQRSEAEAIALAIETNANLASCCVQKRPGRWTTLSRRLSCWKTRHGFLLLPN